MGLNFEDINGQTPIEEEEKEGLLISSIATLAELNEYEQQNIEDALQWLIHRKLKAETIFSSSSVFACKEAT